MRLLYLLVLFVFVAHLGYSQQPFKKYGYEVEVITLSKGKYNEDFTTDSLVQVGSVILNRVTGKVVSFVTYDTLYSEATLDPQLVSRWMSPDPLAEEYFSFSPYNYVVNNPINAIDPDGRRVYFVAGAGNDQIGWNYVSKWHRAFDQGGIRGFTRVNASHGTMGDILFTANFRETGYANNIEGRYGTLVERKDMQIDKAVNDIKDDLSNNPLAEGEQLNLAGYSYGSVLQAHAALKLANEGQYIDNLILVGSPISDDSKLISQLKRNKNIGNVLRIDIEGDKLSNPKDILEFLAGGRQNADPNDTGEGPHFDFARPGEGEGNSNDTYQRIQKLVVEWLKNKGVE